MHFDHSTRHFPGERRQAFSRCNSRHVSRNAAEREFGGLRIEFEVARFERQDSMGHRFDIDDADGPDAAPLMQRPARRPWSGGSEEPR
ncbi:MAG: hypothetical protein KF873_23605 [Gemmataceae bacterium]|nr:hypothetical protein [Gemmataceae bacterium]